MTRWKERNRSVLFIRAPARRGARALRHVHRPARRPRRQPRSTPARRVARPRSSPRCSGRPAWACATSPGNGRPAPRPTARLAGRPRPADPREDAGVSFEVRAGEVLGMAALEGQGQVGCSRSCPATSEPPAARSSSTASAPRQAPLRRDQARRGAGEQPPHGPAPQRPIGRTSPCPCSSAGPLGPHQRRPRTPPGAGGGHFAVHRHPRGRPGPPPLRREPAKLTIGRWLAAGFRTLLLFDPTRGIDVGTKHQIYDLVRELPTAAPPSSCSPASCPRSAWSATGRPSFPQPRGHRRRAPPTASETELLTAAHGLEVTAA